MCTELLVIPVNKVVDPKRIIRKNGGPRRRTGTRGRPCIYIYIYKEQYQKTSFSAIRCFD
jgi:hypothetical protein